MEPGLKAMGQSGPGPNLRDKKKRGTVSSRPLAIPVCKERTESRYFTACQIVNVELLYVKIWLTTDKSKLLIFTENLNRFSKLVQ